LYIVSEGSNVFKSQVKP